MNNLVNKVIRETSPAEMKYIRAGDIATAKWLVAKVLRVNDAQSEAIAIAMVKRVQSSEQLQ